MTVALQEKAYVGEVVLYMALELSNRSWKVCFGDGRRRRRVSVEAGDVDKLREQIENAKKKLGLPPGLRGKELLRSGAGWVLAAPSSGERGNRERGGGFLEH